jgi:hypothetical protein
MTFNIGNSAVGPLINKDGFGRPLLTQTGESPMTQPPTEKSTVGQIQDVHFVGGKRPAAVA